MKSTVIRSAAAQADQKPDALRQHGRQLHKAVGNWLESWVATIRSPGIPTNVLSGLTVAAVALPLNLALAVASGMPPSSGIIAGALGGGLAAVFGGSRLQVTGPAAALSSMVLLVSMKFGIVGVAAAALMVGIMQIIMGFALAGKIVKYVPESVLAGFTTGVGLKILDSQVPEVLGFDYKVMELAQMMHRPAWLHHVSWLAAMCGLTVALLVVSMKNYKRFPAAIVGIAMVTFIAVYLKWPIERVGTIPSSFPRPSLPVVPDEQWLDLLIAVLPLGLLASVESLLSARAVDRMSNTKTPHDPNIELFGQGIANMAVGMFGGLPVSGVIVRSGVNVQSGAKTRLSSMVHAAALAMCVLFFSESMSQIPLAALAGLLCVVGLRLVEVGTLIHLFGESKLEALAFVAAALGTVSGHLMTGLVVGLVISFANQYFFNKAPVEEERHGEEKFVRAVVPRDHEKRAPATYEERPLHSSWLSNIRQHPLMAKSSFVHPKSAVIGRVVLGEHVHVAAGSSVRADEGSPFYIGDNTNIQDGVVLHALKDKHVMVGGERWAIWVGRGVSIAHDALVHGPCYIGDHTFVGFKAVVHDSIVGANCFVGIGAVVVGVEVPDGRFVPHGTIVDSADAVDRLPRVTEGQAEFNEDVVEVNRGLAVAYRRLDGEGKRDPNSLADGKPNGRTAPFSGAASHALAGRRALALRKRSITGMRF